LAAGLVLRNCVLIAACAIVALQALQFRMEVDVPGVRWAAALRRAPAGLGALSVAGALLATVVGAWLGWWQPRSDHPLAAVAVLALAAGACHGLDAGGEGTRSGRGAALAMLAGAITIAVASLGWPLAPCLFAAATAAVVGRVGWKLAVSIENEPPGPTGSADA